MSNPQIPQHEGNQQFHQSTSLEDMMKELIDNHQQFQRLLEELRQIDFEIPGLKDLETQFIQYNARLQNMIDEEELCSAQPIFHPDEDVSVDTLKIFAVNEVTQMDDYLRETAEGSEVFQIEPKIIIALDDEENDMKINVISDKPEKPQIESEEDQPLVLVQPPTLPCTFGTSYKGVKVRERSQIFYTADTFVLDDPDAKNSFVLEVPNELLNLKKGVHASLPKYDGFFAKDRSIGNPDPNSREEKEETNYRSEEEGINTSDSVVGYDVIATELCYKACTPYDRARASILSQESLDSNLNLAGAQTSDRSKKIFKLNQKLQYSLMEKNAEKCRFKEEREKLKEENTMLRETREMEIRKGILVHKASPAYRTELKDFMIENGDFLITNSWNKCVTHLRHKYPITDKEANDPDSLDMEEDAGTSTTIQGED
ncbi:hypothetical protein Scep_007335 [Stephania cephalantha]|uniref:Uncharacterized protein n=1 Tax=Stephania cephalantha TaxID=152367 RepID=A0AAP0KBF5_9MAGN